MDKTFVLGRDIVPPRISVAAGEVVRLNLVALGSASLDLEVSLDGEGAALDVAALYLCTDSQVVDLRVNVRHNVPGCSSRQLFKGLVGGQARASFDGEVYVAQGAAGTKALQENHSILLSSQAVAETRPQLEIYADDVECSHGATTGFLDPDEQFYMRSRGISESEARRLQMISFISPVLSRLDARLQEEAINTLQFLKTT